MKVTNKQSLKNQENHFRAFLSDLTPLTACSMIFLIALVLTAVAAPIISPYGEGDILTSESYLPWSSQFLLGSDYIGRDILSRLLYGLRVTLSVAICISVFSFTLGSLFGFFSAALGGKIDTLLSRLFDAFMSFPSIMLALIMLTALGPSIPILIITISFIDATRVFRVARALAMNIVVLDYVEAAKARGEGILWIMVKEILPNSLIPLSAEFGIRFTYAILFISALSFLGLGVQPPNADLGLMVRENMQGILYQSPAPILPAAIIASVTISVNLIVDWVLKRNNAALPEGF